ncbi:MAG TPA: caspase family protein [Gemmatimonadaceae bacterium]
MAADARRKTTGGGRRERAREPEAERPSVRQGERQGARRPTEGTGPGARRALVIGIDDYGGPPNDLPSCGNDADAIARLLQGSYGFMEIHALRDAEATSARVNEELEWLLANGDPSDRLVLYFSGHGCTKLADGTLEQFLVLHDDLLDDRGLVAKARDLPPGVLTVILDAGFSGGPETFVLEPTGTTPEVEVARVKSWQPPPETAAGEEGAAGGGARRISAFRRFCCSPITSRAAIARVFADAALAGAPGARGMPTAPLGAPSSGIASRGAAWPGAAATGAGEESGQLELDGLLITACQETETAVASTSRTGGLSAFTYSLLGAAERVGPMASVMEVLAATDANLKSNGFRQTPLVLERPLPGDLKLRRFLTLEPMVAGGDVLALLADPRFWETVLSAMVPHRHPSRAVSTQEVRPMATMYQTPQSTYQTPLGGYQQGIGTAQPSPEEIQRIAPMLGPILANVLPAVLAPIVSNLYAQQKINPVGGFGGAFQPGFGAAGMQQTSSEDMQRLLPVLGPVLANVLPAIVPQIVNSIVSQQRSGSPWGGQQQYGFGPQTGMGQPGLFGQPGGFGQFGGLGQLGGFGQPAGFGQAGIFGSPELTHSITQSVNDALRRFGGQSPVTGGHM